MVIRASPRQITITPVGFKIRTLWRRVCRGWPMIGQRHGAWASWNWPSSHNRTIYMWPAVIPPILAPDAGDTHTALSTAVANAAQPLVFKNVPIAGESVVTVTNGSIGTAGIHDIYSFAGTAGSVVTADILAFSAPFEDDVATGKFFNNAANTLLTLWRLNGGNPQVVVLSSDKQYAGNDWLSGKETDADPMILNQPLPANDTYFLDVQGVTAGNYEMFVSAVPEPAAIVSFATGGLLLMGSGLSRVIGRRK